MPPSSGHGKKTRPAAYGPFKQPGRPEQGGQMDGNMGSLGMSSSYVEEYLQSQQPATYRPPTKEELDRIRSELRQQNGPALISPEDAMTGIAESILPYLGESENVNLASWLKYNQGKEVPSPRAWAGNLFTRQRAEQAAESIQRAALAQNVTAEHLGPGFKFLMDTIDLLKRYGGEEGMSRENYAKMMTEYKAMSSSGDFGSYGSLAQSFISPTPQQGDDPYFPRYKLGSQNVYGVANKKLFG